MRDGGLFQGGSAEVWKWLLGIFLVLLIVGIVYVLVLRYTRTIPICITRNKKKKQKKTCATTAKAVEQPTDAHEKSAGPERSKRWIVEYEDAAKPMEIYLLSNDQETQLRKEKGVKQLHVDMLAKIQPIAKPLFNANSQIVPWGVTRIGGAQSSSKIGDGVSPDTKTHIFILDTGIAQHPDLNVVERISFVGGDTNGEDRNGHGTHVAGIAAAIDNTSSVVGSCPAAKLHAIQVLDENGSGYFSTIIAGINYVIGFKLSNPTTPVVINMSLGAYVGTTRLNPLDQAVQSAIAKGIHVVVAAGNSSRDAAYFSPAHTPGVLCIASYNQRNRRSTWSNYGRLVTLNANGESVVSTWLDGGMAVLSGTSMASPLVAGVAALYLQKFPSASPTQLKSALVQFARNSLRSQNPRITAVPYATTNLSVWEKPL